MISAIVSLIGMAIAFLIAVRLARSAFSEKPLSYRVVGVTLLTLLGWISVLCTIVFFVVTTILEDPEEVS